MNQNAGANGLPPAIPQKGPEIAQTHPTANAEALRGPAANDPLLAMDCDSIHKTWIVILFIKQSLQDPIHLSALPSLTTCVNSWI